MVHQAHAHMDALTDHGSRGDSAVEVVELDPVIVLDACLLRIRLRDPDDRPAARKRQHQQIVRIGGVNAPLLVRRYEAEHDLRLAVAPLSDAWRYRARVDGPTVRSKALAEVANPAMVLIELLATAQRTPRNQLLNVGVS